MRRPNPFTIASILAALAWTNTGWHVLVAKSAFLDDAFSYLHIARNILEVGSAQFFPIVDNGGLLASSPLRLLTYLPGEAIAHFVHGGARDIASARLSIFLSGFVVALAFLPFYRGQWTRWMFGLAFTGYLARASGTALQMEGLLVAWCFLTLTLLLLESGNDRGYFLRSGALLALLVCSRPELGIPALPVLLVDAWTRRGGRRVLWIAAIPVAGAIAWCLLSWIWNVYPIPTTYISKIMTGDARWTVSFSDRLFRMVSGKFLRMGPSTVVVVTGVLAACTVVRHRRLVAMIPIFAGALTMLWDSAGYFTWYQENLFCGVMAVGVGSLLKVDRAASRPQWVAALLLILPAIAFGKHLRTDFPMPWNFKDPVSRASAYAAVGVRDTGDGLYAMPRLGRCYLLTIEIGILAYYGGSDCWMVDSANLTTPGGFRGLSEHWLSRIYPPELLRTPEAEFEIAQRLLPPSQRGTLPLYYVQGMPRQDQARFQCNYYYEDVGACLRQLAEPGAIVDYLRSSSREAALPPED